LVTHAHLPPADLPEQQLAAFPLSFAPPGMQHLPPEVGSHAERFDPPDVQAFALEHCVLVAHPQLPPAHTGPGLQDVAQSWQVPEEPHVASFEPSTHAPFEQQKPPAQVPSLPEPHAEVQAPAAQVGVPLAQPPHARPSLPQALFWLPRAQAPLEQHPPLHACVGLHAVVQRCVPMSQARFGLQSFVPLQVQAPPAQRWPPAAPVQSWQEPEVPHAGSPVPGWQVPPLSQQPPLQSVVPAPHAVPHLCVLVLHA
jgi:hypothetical protein